MSKSEMRSFWERGASEDPFYFVDNRLNYGAPDLRRFWEQGERDLDTLLDAVAARLRPGDRVVEIGCGVGRLTRVIAARCEHVQALDISQRMLAIAREHNGHLDNVSWLAGDGVTLRPIPDASADACISHVVFQHIPDVETTLSTRPISRT